MAERYDTIAAVAYVLAALLFLITAFLFWRLRIPSLLGEITGSTARKAIQNMQKNKENPGKPLYTTGQMNRMRGLRTGSMKLEKGRTGPLGGAAPAILPPKTAQIAGGQPAQAPPPANPEPGAPSAFGETSLLTATGPARRFVLEMNQILIHTNEEI